MASVNVAASANGGVATASTQLSVLYLPAFAIDGDRAGTVWGTDGGWSSGNGTFPEWLQVNFDASYDIAEVDVFTIQDNYSSPSEPTLSDTFTLYGVTEYKAQYWDGGAWVDISGASVTGNNKVWRKFTFTPVTTNKIRIWFTAAIDGYARIPEVEAWTAVPGGGNLTLTADSGSFTLAGQSANILRSRLLTAATGMFSLSGQSVNIVRGRRLTAAAGTFTLSGQAATFQFGKRLTAATGSFALTGQSVNLLVSRRLTAATGMFALAGQAATITYNQLGSLTLTAAYGSFALTGQAANILRSRVLSAGTGLFAFTGKPVTMYVARRLTAGAGAFSLVGNPANFIRQRVLHAGTGLFVLTGRAAMITYSGAVPVVPYINPRYRAVAALRNFRAISR